jgi:hypothetical protein
MNRLLMIPFAIGFRINKQEQCVEKEMENAGSLREWEVSMSVRAFLFVLLTLSFIWSGGIRFQSNASPLGPRPDYFTYLGGNEAEGGTALWVDSSGNVYVGGTTWSPNFPVANAFQPACDGKRSCHDAFLAKLDASGRKLLFSTFLDAMENWGNVETVTGIATDKDGNAYICVQYIGVLGTGQEGGFVAKFNPSGRQIYRTPLLSRGGSAPEGIAVDALGNAYVTGWMPRDASPIGIRIADLTPQLAVRVNRGFSAAERVNRGLSAYVGERDAFVVKLDSAGRITKEFFIDGNGDDAGYAIAVGRSGHAYVTGSTTSGDFPLVHPLHLSGAASTRERVPGDTDLFVAKVDMVNGELLYATTFGGGSMDVGYAIAVDDKEGVFVAGGTTSVDFPTMSPAQELLAGYVDAFVAKLNGDGLRLAFSTYLGAGSLDVAISMALDGEGAVYLAGMTKSPDLPILNATGLKDGCKKSEECSDALVAKLDAKGCKIFAGRLGGEKQLQATGIAVDASGGVYIVGTTQSANLGSRTALNRSLSGRSDAFLTRFDGFSFR